MPTPIVGVYAIVHRPTGRYYVGSSVNVRERWHHHRWALRRGRHGNPGLSAAFRETGMDGLDFHLLAIADREGLYQYEEAIVARVLGTTLCLNVVPDSRGGRTGVRHRAETRKKIGEANAMRVYTPEMRAKRSGIMRGFRHTPETKALLAEKSRAYGPRPKSPETREKIRQTLLRRNAERRGECP